METKKILPILTACLFCIGQATAGNVLTVSGAEVPVGGQATIEIGCDFDTEFTAFELQLSLPEGLTIATSDDGKPIVERAFEGSHIVDGNLLRSNGNYKIVCYSGVKESLPTSGALLRITVKADEALSPESTLSVGIVGSEFVRTADSTGENVGDEELPVPVLDIRAALPENASVYDLAGRRVAKVGKGIYIIGGRKQTVF